ncbi:MAG: hypothetical protein M3O61_15860, partial [Gemmatimonadota bacterium]|nr:hypothetical protein [Gemmatimonadota bacterium]
MHYYRHTPVALVAAVVMGCSGDQQSAPTSPDVELRFGWTAGDACSAKLARSVTQEQRALFAKPTLDTAKTRWGAVTAACGTDGSAARDLMLQYVRFTILAELDNRVQGADPAQSTVNHWNLVFPYVGYDPPELDRVVLTPDGSAKVILGSEGSTSGTDQIVAAEFGIPQKAAMTFYQQFGSGDQRGHLFTIAPIPGTCLTTNLAQDGDCYEFSSFPNVTTSENNVFAPAVKVGICYQGNLKLPALGHGVSNQTDLPDAVQGHYPSIDYCHGDESLPQFGGIFGPFRHLAYRAGSLLSVRKAYAAHGGLGGLTEDLSPFGPVDRQVFFATFDNLAPGTTPEEGSLPAPDVGSWTKVFADEPGSILVQNSLGDLSANPVVLSQGGGACAHCGGLDLWGQLNSSATGVYATNGEYTVTWESLQSGPSLKNAPFVLRSSTGAEIARLEYSQASSTNYLKFNGKTLDRRWVRNEKLKFEITVDLDANPKTVSLKIFNGLLAEPAEPTAD